MLSPSFLLRSKTSDFFLLYPAAAYFISDSINKEVPTSCACVRARAKDVRTGWGSPAAGRKRLEERGAGTEGVW